MQKRRNLSMLSDFYEFTMAYGYFESGMKDTIAVFDAFYRKNPDEGGFSIFSAREFTRLPSGFNSTKVS